MLLIINQYRRTNRNQALVTNLARLEACLFSSLSFKLLSRIMHVLLINEIKKFTIILHVWLLVLLEKPVENDNKEIKLKKSLPVFSNYLQLLLFSVINPFQRRNLETIF